jgi:hypothetical protein
MPKDSSTELRSSLNKASRLLHAFFMVERISSTSTIETFLSFTSTDQEIVMPHTEKHANNSSSDASQSLTSQHRRDDDPPAHEQIRGRAYELYIERGGQPGDRVADWLEAEREYYERP